jgi:hypothetical protein
LRRNGLPKAGKAVAIAFMATISFETGFFLYKLVKVRPKFLESWLFI